MKPENITFLDHHRHHYDTYIRAQFIQHLDNATRQRMVDIIKEEFVPTYSTSLWCASCVAEMIVFLYQQYDKWKAANQFTFPDDLDKIEPTEPVESIEPIKKKRNAKK